MGKKFVTSLMARRRNFTGSFITEGNIVCGAPRRPLTENRREIYKSHPYSTPQHETLSEFSKYIYFWEN